MVRFASKRDKREGVCEHLCAGDPGHGGAVATTTGKDPGPSAGVAVGAKRPLEKGWRTFLPTPDHEGILLEFIKILSGDPSPFTGREERKARSAVVPFALTLNRSESRSAHP
jgi:hypothetical protein